MSQQFASDNNAGMCPSAIEAFIAANSAEHVPAYGDDAWTERARTAVRALLEAPHASVHFVLNGTAANSLALAHAGRPYHAVVAHAASHLATDEAGAPAFFAGGAGLKTADGPHAKLTGEDVTRLGIPSRGVHSVKPRTLSLTQSTELGTVYDLQELRVLTAAARNAGLVVHMDGARLANALVTLGCTAAEATWKTGVDMLSLGGVKNGLAAGEALVVFDPVLADEIEWRIKQSGQLHSKMRYFTAPWVGILESGAWIGNARHANAMARRLAAMLGGLPGLTIAEAVQANAVFVDMPTGMQEQVRAKGWRFYTFQGASLCRLMCAWDTEPATVGRFAADIAAVASSFRR